MQRAIYIQAESGGSSPQKLGVQILQSSCGLGCPSPINL